MGKNEKNFNSNLGFTLVELLMVVGIIGILVAMISPNLIKYIDQANKASDIQAAGTIAETLDYNLIFDDEASNEWYGFEKTWLSDGRKHSWIHFNVRDYDGKTYVVYNSLPQRLPTEREKSVTCVMQPAVPAGSLQRTFAKK